MKMFSFVKGYTKEDYKQAICDCCDDIKNRADDLLCDFDKHIREINITLKVESGKVSVINVNKEMCVEKEIENEKGE